MSPYFHFHFHKTHNQRRKAKGKKKLLPYWLVITLIKDENLIKENWNYRNRVRWEFGELECVHKFFPSSSLSHLVLHKVMFNFQSKINQSMKLLLKYFLFYKTHQPKPTTLGSLYNFHLQIYLTIIEWNWIWGNKFLLLLSSIFIENAWKFP